MDQMQQDRQHIQGVPIVLRELAAAATAGGPQWSHESTDLDLTLLTWLPHQQVPAHVNDEVDVVMIAIEGAGVVTVNGARHELSAGGALLIPKGAERAIAGIGGCFSYLSVHARRRGLWPTVRERTPPPSG